MTANVRSDKQGGTARRYVLSLYENHTRTGFFYPAAEENPGGRKAFSLMSFYRAVYGIVGFPVKNVGKMRGENKSWKKLF